MAVLAKTRRFTVDEYHRMGEAGILGEDDRVELIDGEIVEMPPIGDKHNASVLQLNHIFSSQLGPRAIVGVQGPMRVPQYNEPQPDILLLRWRPDFYRSGLPTPADVFLVV
jgi:Uma2 family endonuclease